MYSLPVFLRRATWRYVVCFCCHSSEIPISHVFTEIARRCHDRRERYRRCVVTGRRAIFCKQNTNHMRHIHQQWSRFLQSTPAHCPTNSYTTIFYIGSSVVARMALVSHQFSFQPRVQFQLSSFNLYYAGKKQSSNYY